MGMGILLPFVCGNSISHRTEQRKRIRFPTTSQYYVSVDCDRGAERVVFGPGDDSGAEQFAQQIRLLILGGRDGRLAVKPI